MIPVDATPDDYISAATSLHSEPQTTAVVLLLETEHIQFLLQAVTRDRNEANFTWIAGTPWGTDDDVTRRSEIASEGAITFEYGYSAMPELNDFENYFDTLSNDAMRNPWFSEFEELRLPFVLDAHIAYVIQAVDSALFGIHEALIDSCNGQSTLCDSFMSDVNKWQLVHDKIRTVDQDRVQFNSVTGDQDIGVLRVYRYSAPNDVNTDYYYKEVGCLELSMLSTIIVAQFTHDLAYQPGDFMIACCEHPIG